MREEDGWTAVAASALWRSDGAPTIPAAFVVAQIFQASRNVCWGTRSAPGDPAAMMAATDFDHEWMDYTTNVRCPGGGGGRGREGARDGRRG